MAEALTSGVILELSIKADDGSLLPVLTDQSQTAGYADEAGWAVRAQYDNAGNDISTTYTKKTDIFTTVVSIASTAWNPNTYTYTANIPGVVSSSNVCAIPSNESSADVIEYGVELSNVSDSTITFSCTTRPTTGTITFLINVFNQ